MDGWVRSLGQWYPAQLTGGRRAVLRVLALITAIAGAALLVSTQLYDDSRPMFFGIIPLIGGIAIFVRPDWKVNRLSGWLQIATLVVAFFVILSSELAHHSHREYPSDEVPPPRREPRGEALEVMLVALVVGVTSGPATLIAGRVLFFIESNRHLAGRDVPTAVARRSSPA
jgi:hypothetical protein